MVDEESPFEQRLRAAGADQRDLHRGGHHPPDIEATGEGNVNLTKQVLRADVPTGYGGLFSASKDMSVSFPPLAEQTRAPRSHKGDRTTAVVLRYPYHGA
jgi:hypothetical protein